jgi:hypothetical protein
MWWSFVLSLPMLCTGSNVICRWWCWIDEIGDDGTCKFFTLFFDVAHMHWNYNILVSILLPKDIEMARGFYVPTTSLWFPSFLMVHTYFQNVVNTCLVCSISILKMVHIFFTVFVLTSWKDVPWPPFLVHYYFRTVVKLFCMVVTCPWNFFCYKLLYNYNFVTSKCCKTYFLFL